MTNDTYVTNYDLKLLMLQPKLKLSLEQQREWLRARRQLLEQMAVIRQKRDRLALSLGLLMLQNRQASAPLLNAI